MARTNFYEVEKKVKLLRARFNSPEDRGKISDIEKALRRAIAQSELAEIKVVQDIINATEKEIEDINLMLQWDDEMTLEERKALIHEKRVHIRWIERIDPQRAEEIVMRIEAGVDSRLEA